MKKYQNILLIVLCVLMFVFLILRDVEFRTKYVLPPNICLGFLSVSPEEFFDADLAIYDYCEDYRDHAELDEDGNLVLRLTKEQETAFLEFWAVESNFEDLDNTEGIEISEDLSKVTITGNEEECHNILLNGPFFNIFRDLLAHQLFSGRDPELISVTFSIVDEANGNVLFTHVYPSGEMNLNLSELGFSE